MKLLQYYKQLSFMVGWCGLLPLCTYAQDAVLPAGNLRWDYSDSRVARSVDGRDFTFDEYEVPLLVFFDDFGLEVNLIRY